MSKFSNLYDIDGNIINKAPQHRFTIDETEKLIEELRKKVEENPDNEVYKVYLANAQKWHYNQIVNMGKKEFIERFMKTQQGQIDEAKEKVSEAEQKQLEEVAKAVEELKNEYDSMEEVIEPEEIEEVAA